MYLLSTDVSGGCTCCILTDDHKILIESHVFPALVCLNCWRLGRGLGELVGFMSPCLLNVKGSRIQKYCILDDMHGELSI